MLSRSKLRKVFELFERFRIGERTRVANRTTVYDVAHSDLRELTAAGARKTGHHQDLGWHVAWTGILTKPSLDAADQTFVKADSGTETHKQDDPHVIVPLLSNG